MLSGKSAFIRRVRFFAPMLAASLLIAACDSSDEAIPYIERPPEQIYNEAYDTLLDGDNITAKQLFDEVERQHPYSVWAPQAQVMAAFADYQENRYDDAINTLDRFIQLNPGHRDIAYAYYLRAISYYEQISDVGRDQSMTRLALDSLEEVVRRFPQSEYARDARLKIDLARDHLAGKEMNIARYYQGQGEYLAAINRFQRVIRDYDTTTHTPEALHRLVECYLALGVYSEAQATAAVLGHNFPGSEWYADSYALLTGERIEIAPPAEEDGGWFDWLL